MDKYRVTLHTSLKGEPVTKSHDVVAAGIARVAAQLVYATLAVPGLTFSGSVTLKVEKVADDKTEQK